MGIMFFKIHSLDLKSSSLYLSIWQRQEWNDVRLKWHARCYGDLSSVGFIAKTGDLEQAQIWTPDIELYNNERVTWGTDGFGSRT